MANIKDEYDYVVGIDFGTTYSAACYSAVGDTPKIQTIKNWQRQSALLTTVPTIIAYSKQNHNPIGIGNVPETPASYPINQLPHLLNMNYNLNNNQSVADFFAIFCDHVLSRIRIDVNNPNLKPRIRYCFTLQHPSEPVYKSNLIEAIKKSGIYTTSDRDDKIVFIDSYTATAKCLLKTFKGLNLRDTFLMCDLDHFYLTIKTMLVTNKGREKDVEELSENPPIPDTQNELLNNYNLGGIKIDDLFKKYITEIINRDIKTEDSDYKGASDQDIKDVIDITVQNFIKNIKYKDFASKNEIYITKPLIQSTKFKNPYMTINTDDLKTKVYDPIIDEICKKVSVLMNNKPKPKAFFLFGKLSSSDYVYDRLSELVPEISLVRERDTPAAQGSVYHALSEPLSIQRVTPIAKNGVMVHKEDTSYYDFNYDQYTHVIGIDFGTSFSKWFYTASHGGEPVNFNKDIMQIPTLSLYDQRLHEQKLWGTEAYKNYYSPENSGKLLTRFKLLLNELNYEGFDELTAVNAIASYLKALHQNILKTMYDILGSSVPAPKYRYCLTVPTIWSDKTKKTMRDAAVLAGIIQTDDHPCRLMLVNEPEAAAVFYSNDQALLSHFPKKSRIRALVCDAGGGTVDMATYEFIRNGKSDNFSIDEVTSGSGDICGASFLDDKFRQLVTKKCYDDDIILEKHAREQMVDYFATKIKDDFVYNLGQIISVPIYGTSKSLEFTSNDLSALVFEPVIKDVLKLIEGQWLLSKNDNKALDTIILTGGLGQSRFLKNKVAAKYDTLVFQSERYDQSVVRGAVALALNPNMITQRYMRRSYGIEVLRRFNNETDPAMNQVKTSKGTEYTRFKYDNFVEMNQSIRTYEYYEKTYFVEYPNNTYVAVYASDHQKGREIQDIHDPRLEEVFKFNVEMPTLNKKEGDMIPIVVRMFLGQTEIKIDTILEGKTTRHSFYFNMADPEKREEIERSHSPLRSKPLLTKPERQGSKIGSFFSNLVRK